MREEDKRKVIDQFFKENYDQLKINCDKTATYDNPLKDDLLAFVIQQFLDMGIDRCYEIITEGKPVHYITRSIALNLKSSTSNFYQRYRKPTLMIRELGEKRSDDTYELSDSLIDNDHLTREEKLVRGALAEMDVYHKTLFQKLYVDGWTQDEVGEHYGIPARELRNNVTAARKKFKLYYKHLSKKHKLI